MAAATAAAIAAAVIGGASAASDRSQNNKALKTQQEQNASNAKFLSKTAEKAAGQATGLFDSSARNQQIGMQRALDILGQTIPQQIGAFQQGNMGAQEQLLAGLPQIQNALIGLPTDLSGLQSRQVQFNPNFSQQNMPLFEMPSQAVNRADMPRQLQMQNAAFNGLTGKRFSASDGQNYVTDPNTGVTRKQGVMGIQGFSGANPYTVI